jgi:hypothetical protein
MQEHFHFTTDEAKIQKQYATILFFVSGQLSLIQMYLQRRITICDQNGQILLVPDIEFESYWTTLDLEPEEIIDLYHGHGTCEQFHSELKTDLDLERLPSGKFSTNA